MLATAIIAFREFLEAFLIVGVFLGVSKKFQLKKELEIILAAAIGIFLSLALSTATYVFGDFARHVFTERNADALESYLLIFSGIFIAYVVFSLHNVIGGKKKELIKKVSSTLQQEAFDISLFLTIIFLVFREGFEVALFTASTSLFAAFLQNFIGLFIGFAASAVLGIATCLAYIKFPIGKVFKITEYLIILLGASLVQNGVTKLLETHFAFSLSNIVSFHLQFLPGEHTFIGNFLQSFFGLDNEFSLARLGIMGIYALVVYVLFLKKRQKTL
jgi:high-affinity iron transporter